MRVLAAILFLLLSLLLLPAQAQQGLSQALVVSSCGAPTLTVGGQVQETMDTTGRLCSHNTGGGGPTTAPVNSAAPVASGTAIIASALSCSTGTWTQPPITSYAYQWKRGASNIAGATSAAYTTVSADGGQSLTCVVTATNAIGASLPATSNALAILGVPANSVAPVASGSLTVGSTLSCTTGTWSNSPTSYAYTWLRGGTTISGATSASYVTVTADGGTSVGCAVIATNASGNSVSVASNTLAIAGSGSVWSTTDATAGGMTLTNGNKTVAGSPTGSWKSIRNTTSKSSGKLYVEFLDTVAQTAPNTAFGFASASFVSTGLLSSSTYSAGIVLNSGGNLVSTGFTKLFDSFPSPHTPASGEVIALAIDFTAGKIWVSVNNDWNIGQSTNPATGTNPPITFVPATVGALFPAMSLDESGTRLRDLLGARPTPNAAQPRGAGAGTWTLQPTGSSQKYAPPAGFSAWDGP